MSQSQYRTSRKFANLPAAIILGGVILGCGGGGAGLALFSASANLSFVPGSGFTGNSNPLVGGDSEVMVGNGKTVLTLIKDSGAPEQRTFTITVPTETIFDGQVFEVGRDGVIVEYQEGPITRGGGPWLGISGAIKFKKQGSLLAVTFDTGKPTVLDWPGGGTNNGTTTSGNGGTYNTFPVGVNRVSPSNGASSNATLGSSDPGETVFTGGGTSEYTATFYVGNQANATKRVIVYYSPSTTIFTPNGSAPPIESIRYEQDTGTGGTYVWEGTAGQVTFQPGSPSTISINNVLFTPLSGGAAGTFNLSGVLQY